MPSNIEAYYAQDLIRDILRRIGENPDRDGLKDTPDRVVASWSELFEGYEYTLEDLTKMLKRFDLDAVSDDTSHRYSDGEKVTIRDIFFSSMCEHHMLPFAGGVTVELAYGRNQSVIGLSKVPRIVKLLSRKLQIQERFTREIATVIKPVVAHGLVTVDSQHHCVGHRGHGDPGISVITEAEW